MQLPAIHSSNIPAAPTTLVQPVTRPSAVAPSSSLPSATLGNLSEAAKPTFQALQAAATLPPAANPAFVLPANGNFLRLFAALQAAAAERIYPAPVFSFTA